MIRKSGDSVVQNASQHLARKQHGVIARYQLRAAGVSDKTVDSTIGRLLFPVFPGVFAVGRPQIGQHGVWMAGVLCAGEEAVLGYRSAAALWGFVKLRPAVEVVRARSKKNLRTRIDLDGRQSTLPLVARRTRNLPAQDVSAKDGIPVTSVSRTLLDISAVAEGRQLVNAFMEADRLGLVDDDELIDCAIRPPGRRGARQFRGLVARRIPEVGDLKSLLEAMFLDLCRSHNIPAPEVNILVEGCEVDCLWREQRLVVELDSQEFHRGLEKLEDDNRKSNLIRTAGWNLLRFTWRMVRFEPGVVAHQVRLNLAPEFKVPSKPSS